MFSACFNVVKSKSVSESKEKEEESKKENASADHTIRLNALPLHAICCCFSF